MNSEVNAKQKISNVNVMKESRRIFQIKNTSHKVQIRCHISNLNNIFKKINSFFFSLIYQFKDMQNKTVFFQYILIKKKFNFYGKK